MKIYLYKPHVIKFIISLTSFIQILVYYFLEVLLITLIATSFVSFFVVKFVTPLAFFPHTKNTYHKIKRMDFCYKKNYDIKH